MKYFTKDSANKWIDTGILTFQNEDNYQTLEVGLSSGSFVWISSKIHICGCFLIYKWGENCVIGFMQVSMRSPNTPILTYG